MAFVSFRPLDAMLDFQRVLDELRDSAWLEPSPSGRGVFPSLNVFNKGDDVVVIAEAPGLNKADLKIEAKGNTVRIAGIKTIAYGERVSLHRRERASGRFDRTLTLPVEIDANRVQAEYRDGILALYLPRAEASKSRSIAIN
jgi:HSP20 family protein